MFSKLFWVDINLEKLNLLYVYVYLDIGILQISGCSHSALNTPSETMDSRKSCLKGNKADNADNMLFFLQSSNI